MFLFILYPIYQLISLNHPLTNVTCVLYPLHYNCDATLPKIYDIDTCIINNHTMSYTLKYNLYYITNGFLKLPVYTINETHVINFNVVNVNVDNNKNIILSFGVSCVLLIYIYFHYYFSIDYKFKNFIFY
jgi:hypothetical protein